MIARIREAYLEYDINFLDEMFDGPTGWFPNIEAIADDTHNDEKESPTKIVVVANKDAVVNP